MTRILEELVNKKIEEENADVQEYYFYMLDKIMDACVLLRYKNNSENKRFVSIACLCDTTLATFEAMNRFNEKEKIEKLAIQIYKATNKKEKLPYYKQTLAQFYMFYRKYQTLPKELTTPFFNEILNKQQDEFCRWEKAGIKADLKQTLRLTPKQEAKRKRTMALKQMNALFQEEKQEDFGLTAKDIIKIIEEVSKQVISKKHFKKNISDLPEEILFDVGKLFFTGKLTKEHIEESCNLFLSENEVKEIRNEYNKKMLPIITERLTLKEDLLREKIEYNYNHLLIGDNLWYQKNLQELLTLCKKENTGLEIFEEESSQVWLELLPIVNLVEEFKTREMMNILKYSNQIIKHLKEENPNFDGSLKSILSRFHQVLKLSTIYSHTTEEIRSILGEEAIEKILYYNKSKKSNDPKEYVDIYLQMLKTAKKEIPPLLGTYQEYTYESGNMYDIMRLLMGCNCSYSCLGPGGEGKEAFTETLTKKNADVLMIKGIKGEFIARMLFFRKGNYIVCSSIIGESGLYQDLYKKEFLSQISNELLSKAQKAGDKIDYVFLTKDARIDLEDYTLVMNPKIIDSLPHVDWLASNYLIGGNENRMVLEENTPTMLYRQTRDKISTKEDLSIEDINKIRALKVIMDKKEPKISERENNFDNAYLFECEEVYKGQDWYIAIKKDGSVEEMVLPTDDERQIEELVAVRNLLNGNNEFSFVKRKK